MAKLFISNLKERIADRWPATPVEEVLKNFPAEVMSMCRCFDDAVTLEQMRLAAGLL